MAEHPTNHSGSPSPLEQQLRHVRDVDDMKRVIREASPDELYPVEGSSVFEALRALLLNDKLEGVRDQLTDAIGTLRAEAKDHSGTPEEIVQRFQNSVLFLMNGPAPLSQESESERPSTQVPPSGTLGENEEASFCRSMIDDAGNDGIFADRLEERGEGFRAELIRLSMKLEEYKARVDGSEELHDMRSEAYARFREEVTATLTAIRRAHFSHVHQAIHGFFRPQAPRKPGMWRRMWDNVGMFLVKRAEEGGVRWEEFWDRVSGFFSLADDSHWPKHWRWNEVHNCEMQKKPGPKELLKAFVSLTPQEQVELLVQVLRLPEEYAWCVRHNNRRVVSGAEGAVAIPNEGMERVLERLYAQTPERRSELLERALFNRSAYALYELFPEMRESALDRMNFVSMVPV